MADSFQGRNRRKYFRHVFEAYDRLAVDLSTQELGPVKFKRNGPNAELSTEESLPVEFDSSTRKEPFRGKIFNLCLEGICVHLEGDKIAIADAEMLVARFTIPGGAQTLTFNARVIYSQENWDGIRHGFQLLRGENQAQNGTQEKLLWKFLSEDQRLKNQMVVEELRQVRAQRQRQVHVLQELLHCHAAVARAGSKFFAIFLGILLGLGSAGTLAVILQAGNSQIWQEVKEKQHFTEDDLDIDKQLARIKVLEEPKETYQERLKRAKDAVEKQAREKYEKVHKDYEQKRTASVLIGFYSTALGLSLFAAVFFPLLWILPGRVNQAQKNLGDKIHAVAKAYPEEVCAWGGQVILEQPAKVHELIAGLEAGHEIRTLHEQV